jgi:hypothetical protein
VRTIELAVPFESANRRIGGETSWGRTAQETVPSWRVAAAPGARSSATHADAYASRTSFAARRSSLSCRVERKNPTGRHSRSGSSAQRVARRPSSSSEKHAVARRIAASTTRTGRRRGRHLLEGAEWPPWPNLRQELLRARGLRHVRVEPRRKTFGHRLGTTMASERDEATTFDLGRRA